MTGGRGRCGRYDHQSATFTVQLPSFPWDDSTGPLPLYCSELPVSFQLAAWPFLQAALLIYWLILALTTSPLLPAPPNTHTHIHTGGHPHTVCIHCQDPPVAFKIKLSYKLSLEAAALIIHGCSRGGRAACMEKVNFHLGFCGWRFPSKLTVKHISKVNLNIICPVVRRPVFRAKIILTMAIFSWQICESIWFSMTGIIWS